MKIEKIKVDRMSLASLMNDMFQGRIRVPRFQRVFVWERKRIQELLDSMYKAVSYTHLVLPHRPLSKETRGKLWKQRVKWINPR